MYIVKAGDNLLSIARKEMDCHIKYAELVEVKQIGKHCYLSRPSVEIYKMRLLIEL